MSASWKNSKKVKTNLLRPVVVVVGYSADLCPALSATTLSPALWCHGTHSSYRFPQHPTHAIEPSYHR